MANLVELGRQQKVKKLAFVVVFACPSRLWTISDAKTASLLSRLNYEKRFDGWMGKGL